MGIDKAQLKRLFLDWFLASRPWSFVMTFISISVGGAVAAIHGPFAWGLFMLTLVGMICLHAATNLINDYYDIQSGVDSAEVATAHYRPHPLGEGKLNPVHVRNVAYILFFTGGAIGLWLTATQGWPILAIGLIGVLASLAYSAPPISYKYIALGEFSVFLMWGPLMVEGSYFVQRQTFSLEAFWISIPFGVIVALVLLANNLRDIAHDKRQNIRTIAIILGEKRGFHLYAALVALAYLCILFMVVFKVLSFWSLIVLASLPLAVKIFRTMLQKIPDDADAMTAQLDTAFGVLLLISLILEVLV
ncbi:MAG: 1,4-dihydroxy-2-naphthoate octaprenyltransferase [Thermodesulfobacteriota bacterium]